MKLKNYHSYWSNITKHTEKQKSCNEKLCVFKQQGIFAIVTALTILSLFAFTALGIEAGRWYIVRAELSKAVDAAALVGAKNISNDYLVTEDLMAEVGQANFSPGFLGTEGQAQITGTVQSEGKVLVEASTNVLNTVTRVLEAQGGVEAGTYEKTLVTSFGRAQQRDVEIMMVLDRSGSMRGSMVALKEAATSFVDFFNLSNSNDRFGLISYATGVTVDYAMSENYSEEMVDEIRDAIDDLDAEDFTNTEDAIDQADGPQGFIDQTGLSGDEKIQQYLIFFSDGNPTAFRVHPTDIPDTSFERNGNTWDDAVVRRVSSKSEKLKDSVTGDSISSSAKIYQTGDGLSTSSTMCASWEYTKANMKWNIWDHPEYGSHIYQPLQDAIDSDDNGCLNTSSDRSTIKWYVVEVGKKMAIDHAQELKDKGIKIYTIGLGSIDEDFLSAIASGPGFEFFAPTSSELKSLFQKIALNIKLRLVQ